MKRKWTEYQYSQTREKACHYCRVHKVKCDKKRPCSTCVKKRHHCHDYDKNCTNSSTSSNNTTCDTKKKHTSTRPPHPPIQIILEQNHQQSQKKHKQLQHMQQQIMEQLVSQSLSLPKHEISEDDELMQLKLEIERLQEELIQMQYEKEYLCQQIAEMQKIPRSTFSIDLWNPPIDLKNPLVIWDTTNMTVVGCNQIFRDWTGFDMKTVTNNFCSFEFINPVTRPLWNTIIKWFLVSGIKRMARQTMVYCSDGTEKSGYVSNTIYRSFIWSEITPVDYVNDEIIIDDITTPETYRIPASLRNQVALPTSPQSNLIKLLDTMLSLKYKAVYSDQLDMQIQIVLDLKRKLLPQISPSISTIPPNNAFPNYQLGYQPDQITPPNYTSPSSIIHQNISPQQVAPATRIRIGQTTQEYEQIGQQQPVIFDNRGVPRFGSILQESDPSSVQRPILQRPGVYPTIIAGRQIIHVTPTNVIYPQQHQQLHQPSPIIEEIFDETAVENILESFPANNTNPNNRNI